MGSAVTTLEIHEAKLDLTVLQANLPPKQRHMINEGTVEELKKLCADSDYGEEFVDCYKDHLNILSENPKYTSAGYMCAIKFFSLMESGNNITNSYIKVFPERFKRRVDRGQKKKHIRGEASRYNSTALVNEIRKIAGISVHLIHRHLLHEAILVQAKLMTTAKSELVRQKAAEALIKELKPIEDAVLSIKVDDGAKSVISQLQKATEDLVIREKKSIEAGVPIKDIIKAKIIHNEEIIEEADFEVIPDNKPVKPWNFADA